MCKIVTIINKNKANTDTINQILQVNIDDLSMEHDGYAVFRDKKTTNFIGDSAYTNMYQNIKYHGEQTYILHTRTKTSGADDTDGLHLQTLNRSWVYAHNGTVSSYAYVKDKQDSHYFFKHLLAKNPILSFDNITYEMKDKNFWGRGFLYHKTKKEMFFFCDSRAYIVLLPDCIMIFSYDPKLEYEIEKVGNILGFEYPIVEPVAIDILHTEDVDDLYMHFIDGELVERKDIPSFTRYNYGATDKKKDTKEDTKEDKKDIDKQLDFDNTDSYGGRFCLVNHEWVWYQNKEILIQDLKNLGFKKKSINRTWRNGKFALDQDDFVQFQKDVYD